MAEKKLSILVEIKDAASGVLGNLMGMFDRLISSGGVLTTVLGGLFGGAILGAGAKLVEMFASEEQTIIRLNAALRVTGIYSVEATTAIQNMASKMQEQTTTSREEAINISARFAALAHDLTAEQLAEAQKMVIGYAAATGKDVETATQLMVRAITTHVTHVRGLSVELDAHANQQKRFQEIQGATNRLFDIATETTKGLGGQITQAVHEFNDLERALGEVIVKSLGLDEKGHQLKDLLHAWTESVRNNMDEWIHWGKVVVAVLQAIWETIKYVIVGFFQIGQTIGDAFMLGVKIIMGTGTALYDLGKVLGDIVLLGILWLKSKGVDIENWFIDVLNGLLLKIPAKVRNFLGIGLIKNVANDAAEFMADAKTNITNDANAAAAAIDGMVTASQETRDRMGEHFRAISDGAQGMADAWARAVGVINSTQPKPATVSGRPSTAGGGTNIGGGGGEFDPNQFARDQQQAFQLAKAQHDAGIISLAEYKQKLLDIRTEIMSHIGAVDKMSAAYLELMKVLGTIKKEQPGVTDLLKDQAKAVGDDMSKAIASTVLAHGNLGETVKKEVGKAAAEYAKLDFAKALEEVAYAIAATFTNPPAAAAHWASAAQFAAAGAAMAALGGATGGFSGGGGGGGGAGGAAAQAQAVAGMANGLTIIIPPGHTSSQAWMDEFVSLNEQAGQRRITVQAATPSL